MHAKDGSANSVFMAVHNSAEVAFLEAAVRSITVEQKQQPV